jgi:hypothetical protein
MKNTKYFLSTIILAALILPLITSASWWNPFTWNNTAPSKEIIEDLATTTIQSPTEAVVEVPVIQEKIITKTVTIDNPELKNRINQLEQENTALRQQVSEDSVLLVQITDKHNEILKKYNDIVYYLPSYTEAIGALYQPYISKLNECRTLVGMMSVPTKVYIPTPTYSTLNTTIHCTSNTLFGTTYTNCR